VKPVSPVAPVPPRGPTGPDGPTDPVNPCGPVSPVAPVYTANAQIRTALTHKYTQLIAAITDEIMTDAVMAKYAE